MLKAPVSGAFLFLLLGLAAAEPAVVSEQKFATHELLSGAGPIDLLLDVYVPEGPGPFPVVVLLHGGSYVTGDRADAAPIARDFARLGVAVVAPDLRLGFVEDAANETEAEAAGLEDVTAALEWVAAHPEYGLDRDRVFVGGWSSGGHLSLAVGALYPLQPRQPVRLRGVLDFFGGYFTEHLGPHCVPVLILQGTLDQGCHPEASRAMASLLTKAGAWNRMMLVEGMYHSWEGRWKSDLVGWCVEFVSYVGAGRPLADPGRERSSAAPGTVTLGL